MGYKRLRKTIRKKPGSSLPEYIIPNKNKKSFGQTLDYKYFCDHTVREIAKQLPTKPVICWKTDHILSLSVCAMNKFTKEKMYCKKCSLFQKDKYTDIFRSLILEWEKDDLEEG